MVRAALLALAVPLLASANWRVNPPLPVPRTEVVAAALGQDVAVAGGFLADGSSSPRVDLYRTRLRSWSRLPDLPAAVNHSTAVVLGGRLVVAGGYGAPQSAWVLAGNVWRALPRLPQPRAAAGAGVISNRLYVVGGVGANGLAGNALEYDPQRRRWRFVPGPTPREHLAVVAARGRLYAIGGRTGGFDTNLTTVESWRPTERRWRPEPPLPEARGGTGAAVVGRLIISVGGEAPEGTIKSVYLFDLDKRQWSRGLDLPTPRHGLGVAAAGSAVYVIGGGPSPGLFVSAANESICLDRC